MLLVSILGSAIIVLLSRVIGKMDKFGTEISDKCAGIISQSLKDKVDQSVFTVTGSADNTLSGIVSTGKIELMPIPMSDKGKIELRKYCIEQTSDDRSIISRIKEAEDLYKFLMNGENESNDTSKIQ